MLRVAGIIAAGTVRNGGQELAIQSVPVAVPGQEVVIIGDSRPTAPCGAALVNDGKDGIAANEFGISTAKNLGRRKVEVALKRLRTGRGR